MVEKKRVVLLNTHVRWPASIQMELWTFAFRHIVNQWNNTPIFDIKSYRGDNGVYKTAEFRAELRNNDQHITYCGAGTHHQNGVAERYIRTMVEKKEQFYSMHMYDGPHPFKWNYGLLHYVM